MGALLKAVGAVVLFGGGGFLVIGALAMVIGLGVLMWRTTRRG